VYASVQKLRHGRFYREASREERGQRRRPIVVTTTRTTCVIDRGILGAVASLILRKRNG